MKQMSPQIPAVAGRLAAHTEDSRYETLGDDQIELIEPVGRHGRIVVGVDGSEESLAALRRGIRIANAMNASIVAVCTWRPPSGYAGVGGYEYTPQGDAKEILSGAANSVFGAKSPGWFTTAIFEGNAADVLIEQSRGADMLVVGSRGHGGIAGVLFGSVSARCAEHAHCPVLIIH